MNDQQARRHRARQLRARIVDLAGRYREACRQDEELARVLRTYPGFAGREGVPERFR